MSHIFHIISIQIKAVTPYEIKKEGIKLMTKLFCCEKKKTLLNVTCPCCVGYIIVFE